MNGKTAKLMRRYLAAKPWAIRPKVKDFKRQWKAMPHHVRGGMAAGLRKYIAGDECPRLF